jgi:hypothetical protein
MTDKFLLACLGQMHIINVNRECDVVNAFCPMLAIRINFYTFPHSTSPNFAVLHRRLYSFQVSK